MDFQREQDNNYNKKYTHASESMNWRSMADNNKNFLDSSSLVSDNRRDNDDFTHESVHMLNNCRDICDVMAEEKNEAKRETVRRKITW